MSTPKAAQRGVLGFRNRLKQLVVERGGVREVTHLAHPHVAPCSLYAWISGAQQPSLAKIAVLAQVLGVSTDHLILGEQERRSA